MSSTTQEFYIRKATEGDARGPFTLEQLSSLAENGQADADTYYYDAAVESWALISSNPVLMEALFPAKKALKVKAKTASQVSTLNTFAARDRPITVNDMLLAAEGQTTDTRDKADPSIAQAKAAAIGLYAALAILVTTTAAYLLPHIDLIMAADFGGLLLQPLPVIGLFTLILSVCLGLGAVASYPFVRFVAMLSFGFTGAIFFFEGQHFLLLCAAAASIGLYTCTISLSIPVVILASAAGLAGALAIAKHFFTT
ncbi:MAG: DUF4339 domain-containing protein [Verrucomicrobia bacterium]|nr:MAG: DUF4339 domain-containing protein [Verrucomicrobiota bacterium]